MPQMSQQTYSSKILDALNSEATTHQAAWHWFQSVSKSERRRRVPQYHGKSKVRAFDDACSIFSQHDYSSWDGIPITPLECQDQFAPAALPHNVAFIAPREESRARPVRGVSQAAWSRRRPASWGILQLKAGRGRISSVRSALFTRSDEGYIGRNQTGRFEKKMRLKHKAQRKQRNAG